jgi:acetyl-CoA synthetase
MSRVAWAPTPDQIDTANTTRFARAHDLPDHAALLARSVTDPEWFWDAVVKHLGIAFHTPYSRVRDARGGIRDTRWFVGSTLNLAWSCVGPNAAAHPEQTALITEREDGVVTTVSYGDLADSVAQVASGLRDLGVRPGERVALAMPMSVAAIVSFYAVAWCGAVVVPIFSGFSAPAIAARLVDSGAVAVITADATLRRGRRVAIAATVNDAIDLAGTSPALVVHRHLDDAPVRLPRAVCDWDALRAAPAAPEWVDSEHPVMLAYTSGTTGQPKGAIHVHGGLLVKLAQEVHFQADLHPGERLAWMTDMGWIMGPWATIGTHANGGTLVAYDGAPDTPGPGRTLGLVDRHDLAFLGVSPTLIRALRGHGDVAHRDIGLTTLRAFGSTGEPWNDEPYLWLLNDVGGGRVPIINISGGTEVGACFLACDMTLPMKPCSLGRPALGMAVDVWDEQGRSVREVRGELVCTQPWPGMTRGIWGDRGRFIASYFARWPDVWTHGDWATVDADGEWFLHGRSDDTLNIAGKRIGPAEYESALVSHPAVVEACAVGIPHDVTGESAWCLVVLTPGVDPGEALRDALIGTVEKELGRAFRPGAVRFADALPKTRSAKIVRRAVRAALLGEDPGDLSTLEDPSALDAVRQAL